MRTETAGFKRYRKSTITELRPYIYGEPLTGVPIAEIDKKNGSPQVGDMIARDPNRPEDQWLVSEAYFRANFENAD